MDHQTAVQILAAERYLLKELSPEDRDGFEEHYFTCIHCANEVRAAFTFEGNARAVMEDWRPPQRAAARPAFDWRALFQPAFAAAAAAVLLLGVTLYLAVVVIRLDRRLETATAPRAIPSVVARAVTRGDDLIVQLAPEDPTFHIAMDVATAASVSSYVCEFYDESGSLKFKVSAEAPTDGASLSLSLPALLPGRYRIKVRPVGGDSKSETAEDYSFVVQRK